MVCRLYPGRIRRASRNQRELKSKKNTLDRWDISGGSFCVWIYGAVEGLTGNFNSSLEESDREKTGEAETGKKKKTGEETGGKC